jgi:hypothetical protein
MSIRATLLLALLVPSFAGCDDGSDAGTRSQVGGKADAVGGAAGDLACPADTFISRSANETNKHVFTNCHDEATGQFAEQACCADAIELFEDVSGCPAQTKFNKAKKASDKRCINDVDGDAHKGEFVPAACCAPLCDEGAAFDSKGYCRNSLGQFEDSICCHRAESLAAANCVGAAWESIDGGTQDFVCRATNGQFTLDACCADQCAEEISRTGLIPEGCNFETLVADECPAGSTPNAGGICHNPANGQFVKAACCEIAGNTDDLDIDGSDECWAGMQQQAACG